MEYLEGHDLGNLLATRGPMPVPMAADYIIQICEAVGAAHALGIIHRDLKPSNFFLTTRPDGSALVKVLDFGISKAMAEDGAPDPRLTETQAVFGSPTYMSPEQIRSSKNVDPRSDVWSLGVALFELLTGKMPFNADNVAGLLAAVIADPPMRVTAFAPDVPLDLEAIIFACLEKDPSRRIDSCAELAARLAPFGPPEAAQLAARIERGVRHPSSPSLPPSQASRPSASAPSYGAPPPLSAPAPSYGPPAPSYGAPPPPLSAPSAPVAFGRTGGDLSATGPARPRPPEDKTIRNIAFAIAALAIAVGSVSGLVVARGRRARADLAARVETSSSSASAAASTLAPAEPSASAASSAAAVKVDPVSLPSPPQGTRGRAGPNHPPARGAASATTSAAPASPAAPAVPATTAPPAHPTPASSTNLESRY
jgi:serine/threonine-protein kinase